MAPDFGFEAVRKVGRWCAGLVGGGGVSRRRTRLVGYGGVMMGTEKREE